MKNDISDIIFQYFLKSILQFYIYLRPIYLGKHKEYHGDVNAIPFEEALRELPELLK